MPHFPLSARAVEVVADLGKDRSPRYRCGSGCLVAGRTVLTAAHVIEGAVSVVVRGPDKAEHSAMTDPAFIGNTDERGPDLALIEIVDHAAEVPAISLAAVERDSLAGDPVERCHVIGYPEFMEREADDGGRFRETADALGEVPVLSGMAGGLLSVQVSSAPRPLPSAQVGLENSPWAGLSGAPVVADGYLLAVVTEHAPRMGSSTITATPLTALEHDPVHPRWGPGVADPGAWWARLGASGSRALQRLPVRRHRSESAYWATVRDIRRRTTTLVGRREELAEIASFAAGTEAYRWLAGDAWAGKTSLLAEAVTALRWDVDVVCYFLSRREADADSSRFLAAVVPQLAGLLDADTPPREVHQFRALWQRAAERADAQRRHLLLAVDGLDEDLRPPGLPSVAALLPADAGGHAHVLVSGRLHPGLSADIPAGHPLRNIRPVLVERFSGAQEQAVPARQEIDDLLRHDDDGIGADVLGLLTAAAGPLSADDLAAMIGEAPSSTARRSRTRELLLSGAVSRSLQLAGPVEDRRYQFAHSSLLEYARANPNLNDPGYRQRIHRWADRWRTAGWPITDDRQESTPRYLLEIYPATLTRDRDRLVALVTDVGWVEAAIQSVGVDQLRTDLLRAMAADQNNPAMRALLTSINGQAHNLRSAQLLAQPDYVLRQLWMQAAELGEHDLADSINARLRSRPGPRLIPLWTTRTASPALVGELGSYENWINAVAVLTDGRVVTAGDDKILIWDPSAPSKGPVEVGDHDQYQARAVTELPGNRIASGSTWGEIRIWNLAQPGELEHELKLEPVNSAARVLRLAALPRSGQIISVGNDDGAVLVWNQAAPSQGPARLGCHDGPARALTVLADGHIVTGGDDGRIVLWDATQSRDRQLIGRHLRRVRAIAELGDGQLVSGGDDGRIYVWNLTHPGSGPIELGHHEEAVRAVTVLKDGRIATGGQDMRILLWDPTRPGISPTEVGRHDSWVSALAQLPDGRLVSGGADDCRILVWDLALADSREPQSHYDPPVRGIAALADGRVVTGNADKSVQMWEQTAHSAQPTRLGRHEGSANAVAGFDDGQVISGGRDGWVRAWNPEIPTNVRHVYGGIKTLTTLPDKRIMVVGKNDLFFWNSGRSSQPSQMISLSIYNDFATAVLVLEKLLVAANDDTLRIWDLDNLSDEPRVLSSPHIHAFRSMAALPNGLLVTGDYRRVQMWNLAASQPEPTELGRHNGWVNAAAALPDGRVLTGGSDRRIQIWRPLEENSEIHELNCSVTTLATSPQGAGGSYLVIGHQGRGFSVWQCTE